MSDLAYYELHQNSEPKPSNIHVTTYTPTVQLRQAGSSCAFSLCADWIIGGHAPENPPVNEVLVIITFHLILNGRLEVTDPLKGQLEVCLEALIAASKLSMSIS